MKRDFFKALDADRAPSLLNEKMWKPSMSQSFTEALSRHTIKTCTTTLPVIRCINPQSEIAVGTAKQFQKDICREMATKQKST